jgi:hypothetical protein
VIGENMTIQIGDVTVNHLVTYRPGAHVSIEEQIRTRFGGDYLELWRAGEADYSVWQVLRPSGPIDVPNLVVRSGGTMMGEPAQIRLPMAKYEEVTTPELEALWTAIRQTYGVTNST